MARTLQNEDHKSEADLTGAGGTKAQLLNDTKVYVTANSINKRLDEAITAGDLGGGGGSTNFISNANSKFEQNTVGDWLRYDDGAIAIPVDGTGGSPNAAFTLAATATNPLTGTYSLLVTKDANNRQGHGISLSSIAIPLAYRGQNHTASFYFTVNSGTYVAGDMVFYVYDQTNSVMLVADIQSIPGTVVGTAMKFAANVSIPSNCSSIRIIAHVATTSALAYALKLDEVSLSPVTTIQGAAIGNNQTWVPTGSFTTNTTYTGFWRQVGEYMEAEIKASFSGTPNTVSEFYVNLPGSYTIDTSKMASLSTNYTLGQTNNHVAATGGVSYGVVRYRNTTSVTLYVSRADGNYVTNSNSDITQSIPDTIVSGNSVTAHFRVPILGWSSNIALANSRVEYASNSGMGDVDDSTSFVNDINGSLIPTVSYTAEHVKTARFQSPIQPTDTIQLQVKTAGGWMDMGESFYSSGSAQTINSYDPIAGTGFGIGDITNSTDVRVFFSRYPYNTTNWSASNTSRWRVVRYSNAVPVEVAGKAYAESASSGTYLSTTTSFTDVTNLSVSLTVSGTRRVKVELVPASDTSKANLFLDRNAGSGDAELKFFRGATGIGLIAMRSINNATSPTGIRETWQPGGFNSIDNPPAGTYTYKAQARVVNGTSSETAGVYYCKLIAYEI